MISTKSLYAYTLVLAGMAGFSTAWATKPQEVRLVVSLEEQKMAEYDAYYRLTAEDRAALTAVVRDYVREIEGLAREFDRKYEGQVNAVKDKYDARISAVCTPDKRR